WRGDHGLDVRVCRGVSSTASRRSSWRASRAESDDAHHRSVSRRTGPRTSPGRLFIRGGGCRVVSPARRSVDRLSTERTPLCRACLTMRIRSIEMTDSPRAPGWRRLLAHVEYDAEPANSEEYWLD